MAIPMRRSERAAPAAESPALAEFEDLFQDHWPRVYGLLFRLLGERGEAEDLALEVFLRLYRRPPHYDHPLELRGWLYRVATNLGYNALRARKRRQGYEQRAGRLILAEGQSPDPAQVTEREEARRRVRRVLAQMKPRQARLLALRHSGLSYAEVAAALRVSPNSVGTMLARAEKAFERLYRKLEGGDS